MTGPRLVVGLSADARLRLARLGQGPWTELSAEAEPGDDVLIVRPGGATGYRADPQVARWAPGTLPVDELDGMPEVWRPWPGRRAVVIASASIWDGERLDAPGGDVLRLAAVWVPAGAGLHVQVITRGGRPLDVPEARVWLWLHAEQVGALSALHG